MKKKNLKLDFNKQTIAKLEPSEQNLIKGASGFPCTINHCISWPKKCFTYGGCVPESGEICISYFNCI